MKTFASLCAALLLCLTLLPAATSRKGGDGDGSPIPGDPSSVTAPSLWFVQLTSAPLAEVTTTDPSSYLASLDQEQQQFRNAAAASGLAYKERFSYEHLFNGLSVSINPTDLLALSQVKGVTAVYPVGIEALPGPPTPMGLGDITPDLFSAITMTGADQVQASGITGAGVTVAVVDTGIDYNHPDLGGGFGPGHRVAGGYDFVGDAYTGTNTPHPDPDPMDCNGHGTHVSGIVGANGLVKGVAPGVTFLAYRVFGCSGSSSDDVILQALERALQDGAQVVNMSLGSAFSWPQAPLGRASNTLVNHGVVVVASAGNSGANGLYSMGAPGDGLKVIGVGSVDNIRVHSPAFQLASGTLIGYQPMSGADPIPTSGTADIVNAGRACNSDLPLPAVAGRVALITRGTCSFREKALNALGAGAAAALIYNNVSGIFLGTVGTPAVHLPVAGLAREDGLLIVGQLPTSLTWTNQFANPVNGTGGLVSSFSAFGLSPDLTLKPDLTAPGGFIFSTLPLAQGGYGLLSGTSMSSPHTAGAAALLLEARPNTPSQVVRDILQNSAVPGPWFGNPGLGFLDNVHRQGAGLLDIKAAIGATTKVTPGKLSLGDTAAGPVTQSIVIENDGPGDVTYDLSNQTALATLPGTFSVGFAQGDAVATFSASSVTVPGAGGTASVDVTFAAPVALPDKSLFGGYVVITPEGGGRPLRVPYAGFKGDYQSILVLNPAASKFGNPLLRATPDVGASGPITIHTTANELAFILVHLDQQARRLRLEVFDADSGQARGRIAEIPYIERNATPTGFFLLAWNGTGGNGQPLPSGGYVIRLSIERALGQDDNPADWEIWISPTVTVLH